MKLIFDTEKKIKTSYIKDDGVLLGSVGKAKRVSLGIDIADGYIAIMYDPKTNEITGFTLPYVKEMIKKLEAKRA